MDPHHRFCHNERCWAYGRAGEGHIVIHSPKRAPLQVQKMRPNLLGHQGHGPLPGAQATRIGREYRNPALAYGCPPQAIVAAFSLDERSVCGWQPESGPQCWGVHEPIILRPEGCSWGRFRPMSCVSGSWAAWCGWPRRFRSVVGCGLAAWCEYGATGT
jgi:hypothetical protein